MEYLRNIRFPVKEYSANIPVLLQTSFDVFLRQVEYSSNIPDLGNTMSHYFKYGIFAEYSIPCQGIFRQYSNFGQTLLQNMEYLRNIPQIFLIWVQHWNIVGGNLVMDLL